MEIETLTGLTTAFAEWRLNKRHAREAVPADLLERARRAARRYGPAAVARATKVDRSRLKVEGTGRHERRGTRVPLPTFSRVELAGPEPGPAGVRPFAEIEIADGIRVRLFTPTDDVLHLISSLCSSGAAR